MTNGGGHAANLAIAAFAQRDREPRSWDCASFANRRDARPNSGRMESFDLGGSGHAVAQHHAAPQLLQRRIRRNMLHLHPIKFGQFVLRIANAVLQRARISQHQQAFAVVIEPSSRVDIRHVKIFRQRWSPIGIGELA